MKTNSRFLQTELEKNEKDKEMANLEVEINRKRFAEEIKNISYRALSTTPVKYKTPFKFRVREGFSNFINRLKIFIGL